MRLHYALLLLILAGCTSLAAPAMHENYPIQTHLTAQESRTYELDITQTHTTYAPGTNTSVLAINGQVPGPLLSGVQGERVEITVNNRIDEPVSIHWHGVQLPNDQDGVAGITQEGIAPGESQTYSFTLRNSGTYWYHSHVDTVKHIEMGLQAPFVVHEEQPPADYGQEHVLVLDDIRIDDETGEWVRFGAGVMHGRFGNRLLVNGQEDPTIGVGQGTARLRLINTANARSYNVVIGPQPVHVIGKDIGLLEEPYNTTILTIHPGERYDIITDLNQTTEVYHSTRDGLTRLATLDAQPVSNSQPRTAAAQQPALTDLSDLRDHEPDFDVQLLGRRAASGLEWTLNGQAHPQETYNMNVKEGRAYTIRMTNTQGQPHPMHLHGQKFQVLSRNGEAVQPNGWQDTVMVGGRETVEIAFIAEDKGVWAFHCHILEHADAGMLGTLTVA